MQLISTIASNFILAIARVGDMALSLLWVILLVRVVISWFSPDPYNQLVQILYKITEPILNPIRRAIPMFNLGIDFSPIIAFFGIVFLQTFLIQSLKQLALYLQ
jgi:YggT family protein